MEPARRKRILLSDNIKSTAYIEVVRQAIQATESSKDFSADYSVSQFGMSFDDLLRCMVDWHHRFVLYDIYIGDGKTRPCIDRRKGGKVLCHEDLSKYHILLRKIRHMLNKLGFESSYEVGVCGEDADPVRFFDDDAYRFGCCVGLGCFRLLVSGENVVRVLTHIIPQRSPVLHVQEVLGKGGVKMVQVLCYGRSEYMPPEGVVSVSAETGVLDGLERWLESIYGTPADIVRLLLSL